MLVYPMSLVNTIRIQLLCRVTWLSLPKNGLVNILGGCCGTKPEHIKSIVEQVKGVKPRALVEIKKKPSFAGLEELKVTSETNFINVGERTNISGSRKFAQLIKDGNFDSALSVARDQVEAGAQIIDINMDYALIDSQESMVKFINLIISEPDIARVPIMIDSSSWKVLEAALKVIPGKPIVNSISLKVGEELFIQQAKLINKYGASIVVMAFDEKGQADTFARKVEICGRAYAILTKKLNIDPSDIIFDPNILAIGTGIKDHDNYALDYIEAIKKIKETLPGCLISGGVSNISFLI